MSTTLRTHILAFSIITAVVLVLAEVERAKAAAEVKSSVTITAWLHRYDWDAAVESVQKHASLIREASPGWYRLAPDGNIEKIPGTPVDDPRLLALARKHRMLLRPLVMSLASDAGSEQEHRRLMLESPVLRRAHVKLLHELAQRNGYNGLDLDYEGLRPSELQDFATLVEELAPLLHASGKTLAVSLETQPRDEALPAWRRIGAAADTVRLMTYGPKRATPGPVVELPWVRDSLVRAARAIPLAKLTHGIGIYCLKWDWRGLGSGTWETLLRPQLGKSVIRRHEPTRSAWYETSEQSVWCEDHESIKEKIALGRRLGISHFAFWRLGGEDPRIWDMISALR